MTNTTRPSLYEVGVEGAEIELILLENDGELTPELEARLDAHLASGKDKIVAAVMVVRQLEASAEVCRAECERIEQRFMSFKRNASALKARMLFAVDEGFDGKVRTDLFTIWGQVSAPTVSIDVAPDADLQSIQKAYPDLIRTKYELDKAHAKSLRAQGLDLPAAIQVTENPGTRYLRIK